MTRRDYLNFCGLHFSYPECHRLAVMRLSVRNCARLGPWAEDPNGLTAIGLAKASRYIQSSRKDNKVTKAPKSSGSSCGLLFVHVVSGASSMHVMSCDTLTVKFQQLLTLCS